MQQAIKLKVCGMVYPANILEVAALRPDYMGFIFYQASPRYVGKHFAIPPALPDSIKRVGVFVNEKTKDMVTLATTHHLDYLQLHGNEPHAQCRELQQAGMQIIKAFSISPAFDFAAVAEYEGMVDYFLFDTAGRQYGGTGNVFDWQLLRKYHQRLPFFLSGGLGPHNVAQWKSLGDMNIFALDVNSGVEDRPGVKNISAIHELMNNLIGKHEI